MGIFSSIFGSLFDNKPIANIDGTPMFGDIDINGNSYGVIEIDHGSSDAFSNEGTLMNMGGDSSIFDSSNSTSNGDFFSSSFSSDD